MLKVESKVNLPKEFKAKGSLATLAQALHVYRDRGHVGLAKAQTRSEVNRTTKKLYKQKGTGGARHGARSAPIFVGGGKAHGPRPLSRVLTLTRGLRRSALSLALTLKEKEEKVVVVSGFITIKKTNEIQKFLDKDGGKKFIIALSEKNLEKSMFIRNIQNVEYCLFKDLNAKKVYFGGTLIVDAEAIK